jgi:hypothetical protein
VEEHQKTLAYAVSLIASGPETGPLAENVRAAGSAAANGPINMEHDFHDAGGSVSAVDLTNGDDLPDEGYASLIGHLVKRVFNGLGDGLVGLAG